MEDDSAGIRLQFEALLTEYKMVRDAVARLRNAQGQLDNLALVGLGLSITLLLAILDKNSDAIGAVLLTPILLFSIAFTQLRHERLITLNAEYADAVLRPRMQNLLSQISSSEVSLFGYEAFLAKRSWLSRLSLEWMGVVSRAGVSLAIGLGLIVIFFYLRIALLATRFEAYEYWLLFANLVMLIGDLVIAFFVARVRYEYYSKQYHHADIRDTEKTRGNAKNQIE